MIVGERGFIRSMRRCAPTCRTSSPSATSSVSPCSPTRRCIEGTCGGRSGCRQKSAFDATVTWRGLHRSGSGLGRLVTPKLQAKAEGRKVETAKFPWAASGRAIANGADYGFTKLIFDAETHRVIGGTIVGPSAGMISEVCPHRDGRRRGGYRQDHPPHPTLGETVGMAAEVAHGSCTDLPPMRKKATPASGPGPRGPPGGTLARSIGEKFCT